MLNIPSLHSNWNKVRRGRVIDRGNLVSQKMRSCYLLNVASHFFISTGHRVFVPIYLYGIKKTQLMKTEFCYADIKDIFEERGKG